MYRLQREILTQMAVPSLSQLTYSWQREILVTQIDIHDIVDCRSRVLHLIRREALTVLRIKSPGKK